MRMKGWKLSWKNYKKERGRLNEMGWKWKEWWRNRRNNKNRKMEGGELYKEWKNKDEMLK